MDPPPPPYTEKSKEIFPNNVEDFFFLHHGLEGGKSKEIFLNVVEKNFFTFRGSAQHCGRDLQK